MLAGRAIHGRNSAHGSSTRCRYTEPALMFPLSRFLFFFIKRLYLGYFVCNIISINLLLTRQFGKQYLYYTETFYVFKYYKMKKNEL